MNALGILEREVRNIFAGQKWARENETREARELTRDYIYSAMTHYFSLRAHWAEWIEQRAHLEELKKQLADT